MDGRPIRTASAGKPGGNPGHRPDLAKGRSIVDILAQRADPELSAEICDERIAYSAHFLVGHGHEAKRGNLYPAHALSPEGAARLLDADPRRLAEIDGDAEAANERPMLFQGEGDPARQRTVGAVIAAAVPASRG